jgi:hypothetical protein
MRTWRSLERRPVNGRIFDHLDEPDSRPDGSQPDPYMDAGSHPDCVQRVWDELGHTLPVDCKFLVRGNAVLAHPDSSFVFAMPYGTQYAIWVPQPQHADAAAAGLVATNTWSTGESTDLEAVLGAGWLFGGYMVDEVKWIAAAYVASACSSG